MDNNGRRHPVLLQGELNHLPQSKKFLAGEKKVALQEREYGKNPLSEKELREIFGNEPVADILNTRSALYRERNMKLKPPSKEEAIQLILKDQDLLKRPVIIKGNKKLLDFNEPDLKQFF